MYNGIIKGTVCMMTSYKQWLLLIRQEKLTQPPQQEWSINKDHCKKLYNRLQGYTG